MFKIIIIGLIVTVAGLAVMKKIDTDRTHVPGGSTAEITGDEVKVVITGQILHPGEYLVLPENTLGELIEKAGGCLTEADPASYVPGLLIGARTEFYIPAKTKTPDACLVETIVKYNINKADAEELKKIGLNSAQAAALIEYRAANGDFQTLEQIKEVTGIGEKTYVSVRDYITLR